MAAKIRRIRLDEQSKSLEHVRIHSPRKEWRVDILCGSTLPYADNGDLYRPKQTPGTGSSHSLRGRGQVGQLPSVEASFLHCLFGIKPGLDILFF